MCQNCYLAYLLQACNFYSIRFASADPYLEVQHEINNFFAPRSFSTQSRSDSSTSMKSLSAAVFVLATACLSSTRAQDIYEPGPYTVQHVYYLNLFNLGLSHNIDIWAPDAPGEFPIIYYVPGVTGRQGQENYPRAWLE